MFQKLFFNGIDTGISVNKDFYDSPERFNVVKDQYLNKKTKLYSVAMLYDLFNKGYSKSGRPDRVLPRTEAELDSNDFIVRYILNVLLLCDDNDASSDQHFLINANAPSAAMFYSQGDRDIDYSEIDFDEIITLFTETLNLVKIDSEISSAMILTTDKFARYLRADFNADPRRKSIYDDYDYLYGALAKVDDDYSDDDEDYDDYDDEDDGDDDSVVPRKRGEKTVGGPLTAADIATEIAKAAERERLRKKEGIASLKDSDLTEAEYERRKIFQTGKLLHPKKRISTLKPTEDYKKRVNEKIYGKLNQFYKHPMY